MIGQLILDDFQSNKQKMNNTKTSRLSIKSIKPSTFRVFLKNRNNHHEIPQNHPQNRTQNSRTKDPNQPDLTIKSDNITKMKEYVRTRIKTENNSAQPSYLNTKDSALEKEQKIHSTMIDNFNSQSQLLKAGSFLPDFKIELNNSQSKLETTSKSRLSCLKTLEQKAERLLQQKLNHCYAFKNEFNHELEKEIKQLIKDIRAVENANPESNSSAISLINSKILLFQKLMAESMAESDIMKKHLLSRIANKAKVRRLNTEDNRATNRSPHYSFRDSEIGRQAVINTSINQQSYRSPERPAYNIYRHKQEHFNADRDKQPLPRSSYNRQFLIYDQVQDAEILPVGNAIMGRSSSANMFRSSYRDSFGPKRSSRINIKELDACKNKIKNIPIDFGRKTRATSGLLYYDICRDFSQPKRYEEVPKGRVSGRFLLSQSRREYTKQAYNPSLTAIKHQNLNKLRYQYKNIIHA